jgi:hypothetical protein
MTAAGRSACGRLPSPAFIFNGMATADLERAAVDNKVSLRAVSFDEFSASRS